MPNARSLANPDKSGRPDGLHLVVPFAHGGREQRDELGGKGANLAEMTSLGLPIPPGLVVPTAVCRAYMERGNLPSGLIAAILDQLGEIGTELDRGFGEPERPLLVSVRSGAPTSMPGMMDTVLNIGLGDATLDGLARQAGGAVFALDCYRRLIRAMAALSPAELGGSLAEATDTSADAMSETNLRREVDQLLAAFEAEFGEPFPQSPADQLERALTAVFASWESKRARRYRKFHKIENTGTAAVVQAMVFGNADPERSGTGVLFTRDPSTGENRLFGEYLRGAQGEDIVAGKHHTTDLTEMQAAVPEAYAELEKHAATLERHFADMCDIEFTVERGRLWLLQTRAGARGAIAGTRIAVEMADEGLIDRETALSRIDREGLREALRPGLDLEALDEELILGQGVGAAPGVASGRASFDPAAAAAAHANGDRVILIRSETTPEDLEGILASDGLVTLRGGKTSHAAVVARGLGKACLCGLEDAELEGDTLRVGGQTIRPGDEITVDGSGGLLIVGQAPVKQTEPPAAVTTATAWAEAAGTPLDL